MKKKLFLLLFLFSAMQANDSYELGQGYSLVDSYLYVGGYFSTSYAQGTNTNGASLDDVSFLAYGSADKLSYLVEFESLNPYQYSFISQKSTQHGNIYAERVFAKYQINENYSLTAGKFYTPVGFWNEVPINVLRDTTSNPLTAEMLYPKLSTGVGLKYSLISDSVFELDILGQNSPDIDPKYNDSKIIQHLALSLTYTKDALSYKLSAGHYKEFEEAVIVDDGDNDEDDYFEEYETQKSDDVYNYLLFGFKYESENILIQSELGKQFLNNTTNIQYMGYIQGVYRYKEKHSFILRFEDYMDNEYEQNQDTFSVIGYTYRPIQPVAIKSEYQFHTLKNSDILLLSFSVLF
ncbi:hypothetical protein KJ877_06115 [bacterium]|nr:hypothetical protein [bacterium]MBU1989760.1 hypothetical protein [bacterium]